VGKAKTSFLMHARGIEHHSKGVQNVSSCINLVLATGRIGNLIAVTGRLQGKGTDKAVVNTVTNATNFQETETSKIPNIENLLPMSGESKKKICPEKV
jgi:anaerobic selenocysteine-containing dehydrogenase